MARNLSSRRAALKFGPRATDRENAPTTTPGTIQHRYVGEMSLARYFMPWGPREKVYYALMLSPDMSGVLPWYDWYPALDPLIKSVFPFSLIQDGDTVVQVGANRSFLPLRGASHPFVLAQCVGPRGRVIAVESLQINVDAVEEAKRIAQRPWIEVVHRAASDRSGDLEGMDYEGQSFFWDPRSDVDETVDVEGSSRYKNAELKSLWDRILTGSVRSVVRSARLDEICASIDAVPSFCHLTINGYEPVGIRGLGRLLEGDLAIAFPVRAPEAFWHTGFFEELEDLGFTLVLSNTPHAENYTWFPTVTALRPERLGRIQGLVPGRFVLDEQQQIITFEDHAGRRMI